MEVSTSIVAKLGSLVVHIEEYFSADSHPLDKTAIESLLMDAELRQWMMKNKILFPLKRHILEAG